jgi:hypothetical protein
MSRAVHTSKRAEAPLTISKNSYRSALLAAAMLAAGPAVASATTTPTSARAEQTISRFYNHADQVTPRQGFIRFMSQRKTLEPFFKTLEHQTQTGTIEGGDFEPLDEAISRLSGSS